VSDRPDLPAILLFFTFAALGVFLLALGIPLLGFLWDTRPGLVIAVVVALVVAAAGVLARGRQTPVPSLRPHSQEVHPGIRIHAIPIAGGIGLMFTLGFVAMFWFGLPGLRPVVLALVAVGVVCGVGLILLRRSSSR